MSDPKVREDAQHSIAKRALLARIKLGAWGGGLSDKITTDEVQRNHGAKKGHGRYVKWLVTNEALKPIATVQRNIRALHLELTLPWQDTWRLLPVTTYYEYRDEMAKLESQLIHERTALIEKFPEIMEEARERLATLYDEGDYPTSDELARKFYLNVEYAQVPDTRNFYVDLAESEKEEIQQSVQAHLEARMQGAVADLYQRLGDVVERCKTALDSGKFGKVLWSGINEVCDLAPRLNVTENEGLATAVTTLRNAFTGVEDPQELREKSKQFKPEKAQEIKTQIDNLRTMMAGYYAVSDDAPEVAE